MATRLRVGARPSEEIVAAANEIAYVTDGRGRRIGLKKPSLLAQYRLVELLGDSAKNETFLGMVMPIVMVCEIDGDKVPSPSTRRELDALIQRVEEDGLAAIANYLTGEALAEAAAAPEGEDSFVGKVKKS